MRHLLNGLWVSIALACTGAIGAENPDIATLEQRFANVQPVLRTFCLDCHSTAVKEGELDLERFSSLAAVRSDLTPWRKVIEMLEDGEMPPRIRRNRPPPRSNNWCNGHGM